jgi:transcriptional regulator with XRE-family HTH domain
MARSIRKNIDLAQEIGRAIRKHRKAAGKTQAALAEEIGLESETVSRIENGVRLPSIEKLVDIADALRVPVAVFLENAGAHKKQADTHLLTQKICMAIEQLPEAGKSFVLGVAQNYAQYHAVPPKTARKASKKMPKAAGTGSRSMNE